MTILPRSEVEFTPFEENLSKAFHDLLARSRPQQEEALNAIATRYEEMELSDESYPIKCEISFLPQVKAKYSMDSAILNIRTVFHTLAIIIQDEDHKRASVLRAIAEGFYSDDENDKDEDDFALPDDVLKRLDLLVSELYAKADENMSPPESGQ